MTFANWLRHMFKPFKGTVLESRLLLGNFRRFPRYFASFPGISTFFPGIFAPGVFNFGLVLLLVCSFRTRSLQKQ